MAKKKKVKRMGWYALFVLPLLFIFTTVVLIPFVIGIGYAFFSWDGLPLNPKVFVGLDNFVQLFSDQRFLNSAVHTIVFTLLAIAAINILGLGFALMVTTKLKVRNIARTMLFMPYLIGGLILGYIWKFVLGDALSYIGELTGWGGILPIGCRREMGAGRHGCGCDLADGRLYYDYLYYRNTGNTG